MTEDKMVGWYHRLNGHEFEQAPGDGEGEGNLGCCSPWGHKQSDMTGRLNNNNRYLELENTYPLPHWMLKRNKSLIVGLGIDYGLPERALESYLILCDPMDYTAHGILQARILEWVAFPFSRGSSQPRDQSQVSCIEGRFFTSWATREAQNRRGGNLNSEIWLRYP